MKDLSIEKMRKDYIAGAVKAMEHFFPRESPELVVWLFGMNRNGYWEPVGRMWPDADGGMDAYCYQRPVSPRYRLVKAIHFTSRMAFSSAAGRRA